VGPIDYNWTEDASDGRRGVGVHGGRGCCCHLWDAEGSNDRNKDGTAATEERRDHAAAHCDRLRPVGAAAGGLVSVAKRAQRQHAHMHLHGNEDG